MAGQGNADWQYPWDWKHDVEFRVGESNAKRDWPYIHPGPTDTWAGSKQHTFAVRFGLKSVPSDGSCSLLIKLIDTHWRAPPEIVIRVNGTRDTTFKMPKGGGDDSALTRPEVGSAT